MPNALIALPDVYESVTRRVAVDVTSQLARTMGLPGDTQVYLPGNAETVPMNGGMFGDCCDPKIRYPAEARLVMRYTEELDEAHTLTTMVNKPEHRPLFQDSDRGITIRPVYRYVSMMANFEYNAPNIVLAQRWLDEMRSRISMLRAELYQTLEYHYGIPKAVLSLLRELHKTMEDSEAPTGKSFDDYLTEHLLQPVKTVATLAGTEELLVVPEKQYEVLGWFDFTTTPNQPDRKEDGSYNTSFTYTLHYNRPMQLYCEYPMLVHNKPINPLYRPQESYSTFRGATRRVSTTKGSFDGLLALLGEKGVPYIQHPDTDTWVPKYIPKHRLTFFSGLLRIRKGTPRYLVNLYNLGEFTFTPFFLEYFYQQRHSLFSKTHSVFEFRLYENDSLRSDIELSFIPGSLAIVTNRDLDLTKYYHLQISIKRNWYAVHRDTLQILRKYPVVLYTLLRALGVVLGDVKFKDLNLLGGKPQPGEDGQCSLIGDPTEGGVWPWPWLEDEWDEIPYPKLNWTGLGWPGGGWEDDTIPWPVDDNIPSWPGDILTPDFKCGGRVSNQDLLKAIDLTDELAGQYIDRVRVGPLTVLYGQILSKRRVVR